MEERSPSSREGSQVVTKYKAILDPTLFNNATFWKRIADYKSGRLEHFVVRAEETIGCTESCGAPAVMVHATPYAQVYFPKLDELIFMLSEHNMSTNSADAREMKEIIFESCRDQAVDSHLKGVLDAHFNRYSDGSQMPSTQYEWYKRDKHADAYASFIGHKDFKMPELKQRPVSNGLWLSVLCVAAGLAALVVAFAFLQAAALAVSGVVVAAVGGAVAAGGFAMFRRERNYAANLNALEKSSTEGWCPTPG